MNHMLSPVASAPAPYDPDTYELPQCPIDKKGVIETLVRGEPDTRIVERADQRFDNYHARTHVKIRALPRHRQRLRDLEKDYKETRHDARSTDRYTVGTPTAHVMTTTQTICRVLGMILISIGAITLNTVSARYFISVGAVDGVNSHTPWLARLITGCFMFGFAAVPVLLAGTLHDRTRRYVRFTTSFLTLAFVAIIIETLWGYDSVAVALRQLLHNMSGDDAPTRLDALRLLELTIKARLLPIMIVAESCALVAIEMNITANLRVFRAPNLVPSSARAILQGDADRIWNGIIDREESIYLLEHYERMLAVGKKINRERHLDFAHRYMRGMDAKLHRLQHDLYIRDLDDDDDLPPSPPTTPGGV